MKSIIYILLLSISWICMGQDVQQEIDEQIWKTFTKAWETNDGEAYNAIHSDDVWRINPGRLSVGVEYKNRNLDRMKGQKTNSIIEFSFETRTSTPNNANEVGYFRITNNAGTQPTYYVGRFHVALKKINDTWKITHDWDTDEVNGVKITPESLQERKFIHFK